MTTTRSIGFIGGGNMASALIKGLIQSATYTREQILVSDKENEKLQTLKDTFGIRCFSSNTELVSETLTIVLAIKPQIMNDILKDIKKEITDDHLVISIAAGIPINTICSGLEKNIPVIRVMPNTPALVQKGMSAISGSNHVKQAHIDVAKSIFDSVGETVLVDENMMDAITSISGSGPGYIFKIMECMVNAGIAAGLDKNIAKRLVIQTFLGSAHLARESEDSLDRLRQMVTSPGGTTAAGLGILDRADIEKIIKQAVLAARDRSIELGKKS